MYIHTCMTIIYTWFHTGVEGELESQGEVMCVVIEGPELTLVNFDKMLDIFWEKSCCIPTCNTWWLYIFSALEHYIGFPNTVYRVYLVGPKLRCLMKY